MLGPGQGPSDVLGPRQGSGAVSGPGQGPSDVLGPRQGSGAVSGPGQGPSDVLGPRQGSGAVSGPGQGPSDVLGPRQGSRAVSGPGQRPTAASGVGSVPNLGASPSPGQEVGPGPRQGSGAGQRPSEPITIPTPDQQQKTQATPGQASRQKVVVTGGAGYLGFSLGSSLAKSGTSVILLDLRRPQWELCPGTEFIQADVRSAEALHRTFKGVDCVFHVASYGMSGAEQVRPPHTHNGLRSWLCPPPNPCAFIILFTYSQEVCVRQRVPRLVYTSTINVAFGGKPIEQGDEDSVPYFPLEKHTDHYSRTKAIADQLILMANGTPLPGKYWGPAHSQHVYVDSLSIPLPAHPPLPRPLTALPCVIGGGSLRTCVLRPPGIYGPEEQRHLPRVASYIKKRLFMFRFGDRRSRMNWVHVRNLVQAHVLAAEALTAAKGHVASGQAYYINDGESVNLFEWMAPLVGAQTMPPTQVRIPGSPRLLSLSLFLLPKAQKVRSVAVTHTFQIAKARAQLGYVPDKFSFADAVERYVQSTAGRTRGSAARTLLRLLLGLLLFLGLLVLALRFLGLQP
ncbi:hypothetical protein MJG53_021163, partial [Ovis ammon polii x Ovis aries]